MQRKLLYEVEKKERCNTRHWCATDTVTLLQPIVEWSALRTTHVQSRLAQKKGTWPRGCSVVLCQASDKNYTSRISASGLSQTLIFSALCASEYKPNNEIWPFNWQGLAVGSRHNLWPLVKDNRDSWTSCGLTIEIPCSPIFLRWEISELLPQ